MANVRVTSESLHAVAGSLTRGASAIQSESDGLQALVQDLVTSSWSGAGSESFQELYAQWSRANTQLQESLHGISRVLNQAAAWYEQTEQQVQHSFRG